ncbi:MAG: queuosine precursor transporter [Burkholderiaceae bacterium]|nr:queuosine precursor transporter [Burkholderiaceae bacterium]
MIKKPRSGGAARPPPPPRSYRYYELLMAGFVTVYLCSNLLGPAKAVQMQLPLVGTVTFGAAVLFFPLSYIFGDILTEVYGYAKARRVIWAGFGAMSFAAFMARAVVQLPPAPGWPHQQAYEVAFGNAWRIVLASLVAYFCGEFANSFVLARMKLLTEGRHLWARTIGSTVIGEGIDSALFYPLAFWNSGIIPNELVPQLMVSQWIAKTLVEVAFTPVTYKVVGFLKSAEREDWYDRETDFSPFRL